LGWVVEDGEARLRGVDVGGVLVCLHVQGRVVVIGPFREPASLRPAGKRRAWGGWGGGRRAGSGELVRAVALVVGSDSC
jgi:hypothetical protein